jgi:hypothetical protein
MTLRRYLCVMMAVLALAGCAAPAPGRPPLVNSGSYDWHDVYWGSNGYRLPGWK